MKTPCTDFRQRTLARSDPRTPGRRSRVHLAGCSACREWFRGVVRLETSLQNLPVPASYGSGPFVAAFLEGRATLSARATPSALAPAIVAPVRSPVEDGRRSWVRAFGAIAASLLLLAGIVRIFGPAKESGGMVQAPPDPFLQRMIELNVELATADTSTIRAERLADMAEELDQQMRSIALVERDPENLRAIAAMYERVVSEGVLAQIDDIRGPGSDTVLDRLAARLDRAARSEEELSANVPPAAKEPLREMANVSKKGTAKLRQMLSGRDT